MTNTNLNIEMTAAWLSNIVSSKKTLTAYKNERDGVAATIEVSIKIAPRGTINLDRTLDASLISSIPLKFKISREPIVDIDTNSFTPYANYEMADAYAELLHTHKDETEVYKINPVYLDQIQEIVNRIVDDLSSTVDSETEEFKDNLIKSLDTL